jgi:hypothetical protein
VSIAEDLVPACGIIDCWRQGVYSHAYTDGTPPEAVDDDGDGCQAGECYNCSEKFSREHLKICPMKGIYLLQIDDTEELMAPDGDELSISLNAINRISPVATMRLAVRINTTTVSALVDSGSTHSFISKATAHRLHLHPSPCPGLHVTIANSDWVASVDVCGTIHFFIDHEEFITDMFIIPMDDHEMVLGVHWLRTLGPIL